MLIALVTHCCVCANEWCNWKATRVEYVFCDKMTMYLIALPCCYLRRNVQSPPRVLHQGSCAEGQLIQRHRDHSVCEEESRLGTEVDRGVRQVRIW